MFLVQEGCGVRMTLISSLPLSIFYRRLRGDEPRDKQLKSVST